MNWGKMKSWGLFLLGICLMVINYSRQTDNKRSPNRQYSKGEKSTDENQTFPVTVEEDTPEISSGT